ncbi:hypothetical protein EDB81DRAFT_769462 [Dactylonectria macrodidyma]|uniref:Uncharacterized protein n=1 Tax=Dactylonectria macrodidyma TaxID=307937 RepID=A0A9P9FQ79_9HYPO|nr:hypothetical protein EDB81DRAFT_769462 [Dactylonectria macrodidyma]
MVSVEARVVGGAAHEVTKEEIRRLAGLDPNGRQIKNVLKMANLLAYYKGEKLGYWQLYTVLLGRGAFAVSGFDFTAWDSFLSRRFHFLIGCSFPLECFILGFMGMTVSWLGWIV